MYIPFEPSVLFIASRKAGLDLDLCGSEELQVGREDARLEGY
jgi:hypothetical protein